MVNQILAHVSNTPLELIEFCRKNTFWWRPIHRLSTVQSLIMLRLRKSLNIMGYPLLSFAYVMLSSLVLSFFLRRQIRSI